MAEIEKDKLLAEGAGGMRIITCGCGKHYHLLLGNLRVTLTRDELRALATTAAEAEEELQSGRSGSSEEHLPVQ